MASQDPTIVDGSLDFSGGVDSLKITTIQSQQEPNGLARNELAWLSNATVRDGGITQRYGWIKNGTLCATPGLYQGGFMYRPTTGTPYLIFVVSGIVYKYDPSDKSCVNLSAQFNLTNTPAYTTVMTVLTLPSGVHGFYVPVNSNLVYQWSVGDVGSSTTQIATNASFNPTAVGGVYTYNIGVGNATFLVTAKSNNQSTTASVSSQWFFCQAEQFLIIQTGDGSTLPLFWDGITLRRSIGITNNAVAPGTPGVNEIPAATAMDYFMGRLWYAQGRSYSAGDIVGGASGTVAYQFRDAVLNVTENPLVLGGDGFSVPISDGNIRALHHAANINVALGEGRLFIFTAKSILALQVPVSRSDWIATGNSVSGVGNPTNMPLQSVVQLANGSVNDRSVTAVNGDLFFQSLEPGIRSLELSQRYFGQWGNVQISSNEQRILQFNDRALLYAASGIYFNNRLLQTALPRLTSAGVVHDALIPLDFMPVSSFAQQKQPAWEGMQEGLPIMQMFTENFGGIERAFAFILSEANPLALEFQFWEFTTSSTTDLDPGIDGNRVQWVIETPAYTWGKEFDMKKLVSLELWIDRLYGTVDYQIDYRPDGMVCWVPWHQFKLCSPKNSCEDVINPICYPLTPYNESYRTTIDLPAPPEGCASATGRPTYIGNQFQIRLIIKGWCRINGMQLKAQKFEKALYDTMPC